MRKGAADAEAMSPILCRIWISAGQVFADHLLAANRRVHWSRYELHFLQDYRRKHSIKAVYQDELAFAFTDLNPQAPSHLLIVPREHIASLNDASLEKRELLGHLLWVAADIAEKRGLG